VGTINANLSTDIDVTAALELRENSNAAFQGQVKVGDFELQFDAARAFMAEPNANGHSNSDVLRIWMNATDVTRRARGMWIVDFAHRGLEEAAQYERPFEYVRERVKPFRDKNNDRQRRTYWWRLGRSGSDLREAKTKVRRVLLTPRVATHRVFIWAPAELVPDSRLFAFALDLDFHFGVMHSSVHECWSLQTCSWHGFGNDPTYNTSTCFETFPLPWPPGKEDVKHPAYLRIAEAARTLNEQRERWLNPPEWIEPLAAKIDAADTFEDVPKEARALVRQSAIMAAAAKDARLKKRTLTNLYNERPTWLKLAHEKLDRAVLAAYAATDPAGEWAEDWAAVWIDTGVGQPLPANHPLAAPRAQIDQKVLANLLRLNHARAKGPASDESA
jgi:hypothetical protein